MIKISDVTAGFGSKPIISRFSFNTEDFSGPIVLAGRNGSGKSTFLKVLSGEVSYAGNIEFSIENQGIGWLPQHYSPGLRMRVSDFIKLGCLQPGSVFPKHLPDAENRMNNALDILQIQHLFHHWTDEISGGEWQLICLAQLMVQPTDVWLLDEPTASLDVFYKTLVFNFLWEMAAKGKTIFLATHDLPFLPRHTGTIIPFPGPGIPQKLTQESMEWVLDKMRMNH